MFKSIITAIILITSTVANAATDQEITDINKLMNQVRDLGVSVSFVNDMDSLGLYYTGSNRIEIEGTASTDMKIETIKHEVTHMIQDCFADLETTSLKKIYTTVGIYEWAELLGWNKVNWLISVYDADVLSYEFEAFFNETQTIERISNQVTKYCK